MSEQEVAKTILAQLGGARFRTMTGAKNLVSDKNSLMFMLPNRLAKDNINKVVITLTPLDLYNLEFYHVDARKGKFDKISEATEVYSDQLQEVFTEHTGLDTHL